MVTKTNRDQRERTLLKYTYLCVLSGELLSRVFRVFSRSAKNSKNETSQSKSGRLFFRNFSQNAARRPLVEPIHVFFNSTAPQLSNAGKNAKFACVLVQVRLSTFDKQQNMQLKTLESEFWSTMHWFSHTRPVSVFWQVSHLLAYEK